MHPLGEVMGNHVLGNPVRLGIMLYLLPRGKVLFIELQRVLDLTPGNLDSHLRTLEKNGYIKMKKIIHDRPRTAIFITSTGIVETRRYVHALRNLLDSVSEEDTGDLDSMSGQSDKV